MTTFLPKAEQQVADSQSGSSTTNGRQGWARVIESRKQAVSIRMNSTDVRKVKKLAGRLGVRDSDVIRFAVKSMLARLGPLYDPDAHGRNLVPVFVESGAE